MTAPQYTITAAPSLGRGMRNAAQSCLSNRWALLAVAGLAVGIGTGLYFGRWAWLVAVGAAPIILSTLPCLIMCGLGVCMICKGQKQSTATDAATSSVALAAGRAAVRSAVSSNCCQEPIDEAASPQITQVQSIKETGGFMRKSSIQMKEMNNEPSK